MGEAKGCWSQPFGSTADRAVEMRGWDKWSCSLPGGWALPVLAAIAVLLGGCLKSLQGQAEAPATPAAATTAQISEVTLQPPSDGNAGPVRLTGTSAATARGMSYYGDDTPVIAEVPNQEQISLDDGPRTTGTLPEGPQAGGQGYEMNFENAPVATVAKAILGDILGVGYTIDARVQSSVSLSSGRPVPKKDILYVLESALRVSNVALVREARGYRLVPAAEAVGSGAIDGTRGLEAGFGISVVPLQFVAAQTLTKLLENFASKPGMVRADPARNLVVIQGNGADRRAAIDTVLSFDADWMRGQSVGIYPVTNSTPEPVIAELERIIDAGEGGLSQNLVKLQPIARQNAILVVTRRPAYLRTVSTWISRLDKSGSAGTGVKVYRMRYGDARQVAALLNDIFLGSSGGGLDTAANQLAPGSGMTATSSDRPNFAGGQQGSSAQLTRAAFGQQPGGAATFDGRFDLGNGRGAQGQGAPAVAAGRALAGGMGAAGPVLPNVRIAADTINNALLIYANQENYRIIERTLNQLDRPQLQVAIDATIAEVTINDSLKYGVQFFLKSQDLGLNKDAGSLVNNVTSTAAAALSRVLPGFNFLVGTEAEPRVILDALHAVTDVKILSTPSVVAVDNQFATLQVGDQIPVTTQSAQSVIAPGAPLVNNVDYRNTGVILRVAPRINANGNVLLDVEQEISAVAKTPTADTLTPTVSQRRVRSTISVASGQTVLLAGLISDRQDRNRSGIPGLDNIPGLGALFSHTIGASERTELIIFIRPQIIRNGADAHRIATELRGKMRSHLGPPVVVVPAAPCCIK